MNCIHCKGKVPKVADPTRIIICNACTQNLVLTRMKEEGAEYPWIRSQRLAKVYKKRREGAIIRKLKPLESRYA